MIRYREAILEDIPELEAMRLPDTAAGPTDPRMARYLLRKHHPQKAKMPRVMFVAESEEGFVGYVGGHLTERYGCDGEVQYLYVAPEHRRAGVASELLRRMAEWFEVHGAERICVDVEPDNLGARELYRRHGAVDLNPYWLVWPNL